MTTRGADLAGASQARTIDRHVLDSNLLAGGALVVGSAFLVGWPLSLIAAVYVAGVSAFFAVIYARRSLSMKQELLVWVAPWLLAIVLWAIVIGRDDSSGSLVMNVMLNLWVGTAVGTGCYLVWQTIALAVRLVISPDSRPTSVTG